MKKHFSKKLLILVLLAVSLCLLFVAVGCDQTNTPPKQPTQTTDNNTYTITFKTGFAGLTVAPLSAKAGQAITPPTSPALDGYRFDGWLLDGERYEFDVMPNANITLTAKWLKLYSVTFDTGTNDVIPIAWYAPGDTVQAPPSVTRDSYKLVGWSLNGKPYEFGEMPAENITLTALWEAAVTITFNTGASDFTVDPIIEVPGAEISAPVVRRPGYYLECWLLNGKEYEFTTMPSVSITLTAKWLQLTNLPAMFIDLSDGNGKKVNLSSVGRENYVNSTITLTNTDEKYELDSLKSEFKGRGNGSWTSANKKGYKIKFDKKQSVFGRPANKHWVIIACTNFDDVTMSRNYLAYNMANEVLDGIEYTTPAYWIDVYVNGEYHGVYVLCEHVRVGDGRVDIQSDYGVDDTGYLIEYDYYAAENGTVKGVDYFTVDGVKHPFTMHSPDPEDYATEGNISVGRYMQQVAYIQDYVSRVYKAAYSGDYVTFSELVDTDSFVDMYILHELFKNVDTGYSSFYLYKKPGGKLYAGPAWDFDATTNGATDRGDRSPSGIYVADPQHTGSQTGSELYINLYNKSAGFRNDVKTRWRQLSPNIRNFIDTRLNDTVYEENKVAMGKNFAKWKGKTQTQAENDWLNDVKILKNWLIARIQWLDGNW